MKLVISLLSVLSLNLWAYDCPSNPEEVLTQIESQTECYFAAKIARECSWGSSIDVQFVSAASQKCTGFESKLTRSDRRIYNKLLKKCVQKYENEEGTLYRSMMAYCSLSVVELMNELYSPVE